MSQQSKLRHSRKQWKHKATERAEHNRYLRKELARLRKERDRCQQIMQATIAFWTTETLELMNTMTYGGIETAQYPLAIYQPALRGFFTLIVPLACVAYFPVVALLGVTDPLGTSRPFQQLAPLAGIGFLWLALQGWKYGVRHYTSTGS